MAPPIDQTLLFSPNDKELSLHLYPSNNLVFFSMKEVLEEVLMFSFLSAQLLPALQYYRTVCTAELGNVIILQHVYTFNNETPLPDLNSGRQ